MSSTTFVFCHGWGYSPKYWEKLIPLFKDANTYNINLGYYGERDFDISKIPENSIAVGHSLGFKKLCEHADKFQALISIQGFTSFLGYDDNLNKTRRKEAMAFAKSVRKSPLETLSYFQESAGVQIEDYNNLNVEPLTLDLNDLIVESTPVTKPTLVLGSENDTVVPKKLLFDNYARIASARLKFYTECRHCLGYLEPEDVYSDIISFIHELGL